VNTNHNLIARNFEKEVHNNNKNPLQMQLAKKRTIITSSEFFKFFGGHRSLHKG
jgi:hypothetical protein